MSGQRATDRGGRLAATPRSSRRVRAIAAGAAFLSLVVCGAVARASNDSGTDTALVPKAGAAPTSSAVDGEVVPPDDLGDDPDLDGLAQSCFDGELIACDRLFLQSPVDSDYEDYGDTCAGRQPQGTGQFCALGVGQPSGDPVPPEGLGSDSELEALAQTCYSGDMEACDQLYGESESGSPYQVYGDTCAGRQPENTGSYCTALRDPVPGTAVAPSTGATPTSSVAESTTGVPTTEFGPTTEPSSPGEIPAPTLEPTDLGDDPTLDALAQSCYDGDLAACDELYRESESGTPYRNYGDTCAGRQSENSGTWCADVFGTPAPSTTIPTSPSSSSPLDTTTTTTTTSGPPTTVPPVTAAPTTAPTSPTTEGPSPTVVPGVIPPPTLEPTALGTDPALDALAEGCHSGDMAACDELWRNSEVGSPYRNFADTCAGRQEPNGGIWCADAFSAVATTSPVTGSTVPQTSIPSSIPPATQQPTGLGSDPTLDQLAQSCYAGEMQACDDLFDSAPIGSTYRAYGDTCAGRQQPATFNYCHVVFPAATD